MKNRFIALFLGVLLVTITSCESVKNTNKTQRGAAIGTAAGVLIGGILGNNLGKGGNTAMGAVIGGVVGGVAGGVIGNKMDKQARKIDEVLPGAEVNRVGEGIVLVLGENSVRFDTGKATLTAAAKENLDKLIPVFNEYPDQKLSENRAAAVKTYLAGKGIASSRIVTEGMGINDPIDTNDTAEGRAKNRRVEFTITANTKMVKDAEKEAQGQ